MRESEEFRASLEYIVSATLLFFFFFKYILNLNCHLLEHIAFCEHEGSFSHSERKAYPAPSQLVLQSVAGSILHG